MSSPNFPWKRFWIPGSSVHQGEGTSSASVLAETTASIEELLGISCLVLLGAPGIGKSNELRRAFDECANAGRIAVWIELSRVRSAEDFQKAVLSGTNKTDFAQLSEPIELFLDGLDEAAVQVRELFDWIVDATRKLFDHLDRSVVAVRLTCRNADWNLSFQDDLRSLWGNDRVGVFQLAPLDENDVRIAAEALGQERDRIFSNLIEAAHLWPLARLPVTLRMLLTIAKAQEELPRRRLEIYRRGLLALLDEPNLSRRRIAPEFLAAEEKLLITARLAAASMLSNRHIIWTGLYAHAAPEAVLAIQDIAGGEETILGARIRVTENELRSVVASAIFVRVDDYTYTWAHLSFAEFLAAYYLTSKNIEQFRILDLISSPTGPANRVAPQMREVAAWLAAMAPSVFERIVMVEPEVLLRSDAIIGDQQATQRLVSELLRRVENGDLLDYSEGIRDSYGRLAHRHLADQLGPIIGNSNLVHTVRRAAVDIAGATKTVEVVPKLLALALDNEAPPDLRARAVIYIGRIASENDIRHLRPLIAPANDPDDEIKGAALSALWPKHLTPTELYAHLEPPKAANLVGTYSVFLRHLDVSDLDAASAVSGIKWIRSHEFGSIDQFTFDPIIIATLKAAWAIADDDEVTDAFAELIVDSIRRSHRLATEGENEFIKAYNAGPPERRRTLLRAVFRRVANNPALNRFLFVTPWPLLTRADLPWLLNSFNEADESIPREWMIESILWVTHGLEPDDVPELWDVADRDPTLAAALVQRYSMDLSAEVTQWHRRQYQRRQEQHAPPTVGTQITALLEKCASDSFAWWQLNLALLNADDPSARLDELKSNLRGSAGWRYASEEEKVAILGAAKRYLTENRVSEEEYFRPNLAHRPAMAAVRALRLLFDERPDEFSGLGTEIWEAWIPALLSMPANDPAEDFAVRCEMVARAYQLVPAAVLRAVRQQFEKNINLFEVADLVGGAFDPQVGEIIWSYLMNSKSDQNVADRLLGLLFEKKFEPAIAWIRNSAIAVGKDAAVSSELSVHFVSAFAIWFQVSPQEAWAVLSELRQSRPERALEIWGRISGIAQYRGPKFVDALSLSDLEDIYLWSSKAFPQPEPLGEGRYLGTPDHVGHLRERILSFVSTLGTAEALASVRRLEHELPEQPWLKWYEARSEELHLRNSWNWPSPREALERIAAFVGVSIGPGPVSHDLISSAEALSTVQPQVQLPNNAEVAEKTAPVARAADNEIPTTAQIPRRVILVVATEWFSGHGGLSSLNRNLCIALAAAGNDVTCIVPEATDSEKALALRDKVRLLDTSKKIGIQGISRLLTVTRARFAEYVPELVVGHDHVTGPAASHVSAEIFPESKYVHVVHTIPDDIEPYKLWPNSPTDRRKYSRGNEKRKEQIEFCMKAALVIAVGPLIRDHLLSNLPECSDKVVELRPGLDPALLSFTRARPVTGRRKCLFMGRVEDPLLKGVDIAAGMLSALATLGAASSTFQGTKLVMRGTDPATTDDVITALCEKYRFPAHLIEPRPYSADPHDIEEDLKSSSVLIMPSRAEGFGLVALEAIAIGIPVLISEHSGIARLLVELDRERPGLLPGWKRRIIAVDGVDTARDSQRWADAVHKIFEERDDAFREAEEYRKQLHSMLSWPAAAMALTARLSAIF